MKDPLQFSYYSDLSQSLCKWLQSRVLLKCRNFINNIRTRRNSVTIIITTYLFVLYLPANDDPIIYLEIVLQLQSKGKLQTSRSFMFSIKKRFMMCHNSVLFVFLFATNLKSTTADRATQAPPLPRIRPIRHHHAVPLK